MNMYSVLSHPENGATRLAINLKTRLLRAFLAALLTVAVFCVVLATGVIDPDPASAHTVTQRVPDRTERVCQEGTRAVNTNQIKYVNGQPQWIYRMETYWTCHTVIHSFKNVSRPHLHLSQKHCFYTLPPVAAAVGSAGGPKGAAGGAIAATYVCEYLPSVVFL